MSLAKDDARRAVAAELAAMAPKPPDYDAKRIPRVHLAVIFLAYTVIDAEGDVLECRTWATGKSPGGALRHWKHTHPEAAATLTSHTVGCAGRSHLYDVQKPVGDRIKINDYALKHAADGLPIYKAGGVRVA